MADVATVTVETNNARNVILRVALLSDGSGVALQKIFDAASATFANTVAGQAFLPGVHTTIVGMDFDVQDQKFALYWEAGANALIGAWGSSPESFDWKEIGGIRVPAGLAGATGSILLSTIDPMPDSTLSIILKLRKNV